MIRGRKACLETRDQMARARIGLALGGGAARGWAHLGVVESLVEIGIEPDIVAGTSIGALVGGCYASGHLKQLKKWACGLTKLRMLRYMDVKLRGRGLIGGDRLLAEMERHLQGIRIEDLGRTFASVCTDLYSGHEVWLREGELTKAIRASFAIPGFFEPVQLNGRWLVDGGLVNPVPVSVCRALGADMVIAVRPESPMGGLPAVEDAGVASLNGVPAVLPPTPDRAPTMLGAMMATINIVTDRVSRSRLVSNPPDINISTRVGHIALTDFHRADEAIEIGHDAVRAARHDLKDALGIMKADHHRFRLYQPTKAKPKKTARRRSAAAR